jgi:hypothetical protein
MTTTNYNKAGADLITLFYPKRSGSTAVSATGYKYNNVDLNTLFEPSGSTTVEIATTGYNTSAGIDLCKVFAGINSTFGPVYSGGSPIISTYGSYTIYSFETPGSYNMTFNFTSFKSIQFIIVGGGGNGTVGTVSYGSGTYNFTGGTGGGGGEIADGASGRGGGAGNTPLPFTVGNRGQSTTLDGITVNGTTTNVGGSGHNFINGGNGGSGIGGYYDPELSTYVITTQPTNGGSGYYKSSINRTFGKGGDGGTQYETLPNNYNPANGVNGGGGQGGDINGSSVTTDPTLGSYGVVVFYYLT